jgi:glycine/D-amino acid oxidase-like deaminating enzyme
MQLRTFYPFSLLRYGILHSYPSLKKDIRTEAAVIGAGITGALAAYHLQQAGISCVVVDRRHVGMGSTAASTSLLQYEIDVPMFRLAEMVGEKNAVRSYEVCRDAVGQIGKICSKLGSGNNYQKKCSLQFASFTSHAKTLEKEFRMRLANGFRVELLDGKDLLSRFGFKAPAGILSKDAAQADAYLLTHDLLATLEKGSVYDHTEVEGIEYGKNEVRLNTAAGPVIRAKQVIVAGGYESRKYLPRKVDELRCTYAMVSEPFEQEEFWEGNCLVWETADPYLYFRTTPDRRLLIGGKDSRYYSVNTQMKMLPAKVASLKRSFGKLFPHLPLTVDFQWAGAFATTRDGLPFIGRIAGMPRTFFALGYGGNGITFSYIAAKLAVSALSGKKHPDESLFSFDRWRSGTEF